MLNDISHLLDKNKDAKLKVKNWEDGFKKEHGSRPNKEALQSAPEEIKEAYKTYWKTTKQLASLKREKESKTNDSLPQQNILESQESGSEINCTLPPVEHDHVQDVGAKEEKDASVISKANPKGTWGRHLSKQNDFLDRTTVPEFSLYSQMAENLKSHAVVKTRTSLKRLSSKSNIKKESKFLNESSDFNNLSNEEKSLNEISNFPIPNIDENAEKSNATLCSVLDNQSSKNLSCVIRKTSMNSQPVNPLHVDSIVSGNKKAVHQWNENWVRRCNAIYDTDVCLDGVQKSSNHFSCESNNFDIKDNSLDKTHANDENVLELNDTGSFKRCESHMSSKDNNSLINTNDNKNAFELKDRGSFKRRCESPESNKIKKVKLSEISTNTDMQEAADIVSNKIARDSYTFNEVSEIQSLGKGRAKISTYCEESLPNEKGKEWSKSSSPLKENIVVKTTRQTRKRVPKLPVEPRKDSFSYCEESMQNEILRECPKITSPIKKNLVLKTTRQTRKRVSKLQDKPKKDTFSYCEESMENEKLGECPKNISPLKENLVLKTTRQTRKRVSKLQNKPKKDSFSYCEESMENEKLEECPKNISPLKENLAAKTTRRTRKPVSKLQDEPKKDSSNVISELNDYDELDDMGSKPVSSSKSGRRYVSKEERILNKISSGKLNENFLKINLKKKVFVRGKKRMTSEKYKRQEWKKKQVMKSAESGNEKSIKKLTCFRCGDFGHWANKCPGKIGDNLMPITEYDENESIFLTLNEAADLAKGIKPGTTELITKVYDHSAEKVQQLNENRNSEDEIFSDWDDDIISSLEVDVPVPEKIIPQSIDSRDDKVRRSVQPLYKSDSLGNVLPTPSEVWSTLKLFGHSSFRCGQEETIMRILSGKSSLLIQSTGSGKSLCYQLPAYLYAKHSKCVTICVSPLVSLMEDQVSGLPPFLKGVCLHTQQSPANREKSVQAIQSGNVHIILVSPEAIVSSSGGGVLGGLLKELPPIAFACLDEAHCLSEWSHNFRPSYLQVCKILREKLFVKTFLGLTATARSDTAESIAKNLEILDFSHGVIMGSCIPDNLRLSVSRDEHRELALIKLLTGERFEGCSSIIIYCTRREECERIATFIRTQLVEASQINVKDNAKRQRGISLDAEAYHAGLSGFRRQQIQKRFMSGKLRIVVATVAFGMGIDKADVQGIIHYNMPRNLESYVQEIGRAGRDGNTAHCHLFLDSSDGKDINELRRHIFVNSVDRYTVRKLLNKVFVSQNCSMIQKLREAEKIDTCTEVTKLQNKDNITAELPECPGHEIVLPIEELIETLDMPEENIQTLLCYLETHSIARLKLSHHVYATCKVSCYRGPKQLCAVSRKCPPLAVAIAMDRRKGVCYDTKSSITFPVVEIASLMGWQSRIVKQELKRLEWNTDSLVAGGKVKPSGVRVELSNLGFSLNCRCDLTEEMQDAILEDIYERALLQEKNQLKQLQFTYETLKKSSDTSILQCCDSIDESKCSLLKETISKYFISTDEGLSSIVLEDQLYIRPEIEQRIRSDVRSLLSIHSDQSWTGRAIARVFHGISSPNFPAKVWGRVRKFWRLHLQINFNLLVSLSTQEILKFK